MADKRDDDGGDAGKKDDDLDLNADWRDAPMEDPDFSEKSALKISRKVLTWGIVAVMGVLISGGIVYGIWAWTSDTPDKKAAKSPSAKSKKSGKASEKKTSAEPAPEKAAKPVVEKKPDGPAVAALKRRQRLRFQPLVTGKVRVNIPGKAVLWISGIKMGNVKSKTLEIQEGEHLLRAIRGRNQKRQELTKVIDITEGELTRITVNFRREKIVVH
jgi:hypothetical protein